MRERTLMSRMNSLVTGWRQADDQRAIFLECYAMMTGNMFTAVHNGRFQDPTWVTQLLHHFATYYFDALDAYERDIATAPTVWQLAHGAAAKPETMVLQNLFLGVNAHINYDLALTVVDLLAADWATLSDKERARRYSDYTTVNEIIADTIDRVQDEVVESRAPWLNVVDWLGGRLDERLISYLLTQWRDEVWQTAVQMLTNPEQRETRRQQLEATAVQRSRFLLGKSLSVG